MQALSLNEFIEIGRSSDRIAIFREISAGALTPLELFECLNEHLDAGFIFEDLQTKGNHVSFMCFDPLASLQVLNGTVTHTKKGIANILTDPPYNALKKFITSVSCCTRPEAAQLINAVMGFVSYDAIRYIESIPDNHPNQSELPDILVNSYRVSVAFDHQRKTILIAIITETCAQAAYFAAQNEIDYLIAHFKADRALHAKRAKHKSTIRKEAINPAMMVDVKDADFLHMVNKAKAYITEGDAFQIVLSRSFSMACLANSLEVYRALREVSPAPFMFYFAMNNFNMLGASPERLIKVEDGNICIHPLAGTRKHTNDDDKYLIAAELLSDEKEIAEHMMLVDLARNDLGIVSEPGSVHVSELLQIKHYSHISHIASTVTGKLDSRKEVIDAFMAAFPAGTLSGAPKIRAMQIIDELEDSRRGLYGGAVLRFDLQGNLESCIAIRSAVLKNGIATVRAGAGIVYDSNPINEVLETQHKAQCVLDAIALANERAQ